MHSKTRFISRSLAIAALAAALAVPAAAQAPDSQYGVDGGAEAGYDAGYSYFRNLRGAATLVQYDGEEGDAEINQPVLAGDRLRVVPGSMAEVLLSDGNLLRIDGGSDLVFDRLAYSPEGDDRVTELTLYEGNLQLVVFDESAGDRYPQVALPNGTVYIDTPGVFRIAAERGDWAEVVARRGRAEVVSDAGSVLLRADEELVLAGRRAGYSDVRQAGRYDDLERWAERLDDQRLDIPEVDSSLAYAAAPLNDHGTWITVESRRAWRPRVSAGWSPYHHGRWRHTPIGMTWISYEPWGWVPYHYGSWDYAPSYGWVWYPGTSFAPAWVYWYWGPSQVAWVPVGYYTNYYRSHYRSRPGFRYGVYGWAGGPWSHYDYWNWCSTAYLGRHDQWRHVRAGRDWKRHARRNVVPRGLITTDTRGLTPDRWGDPAEVTRVLRTRPGAGGGPGVTRTAGELPDVTPFVARRGDLPPEVERRVVLRDGERGERLTGTPLRPQSLGDTRTVRRRPGSEGSAAAGGVAGRDA
ncbi:MAG TPA: DUF6600 domain-containing protein, partial [Thermoanaerobaculia bacterium]|nr:DUF6600 domain-containing protein [Thermoanaerobaculia bacterium]